MMFCSVTSFTVRLIWRFAPVRFRFGAMVEAVVDGCCVLELWLRELLVKVEGSERIQMLQTAVR